MPIPIPEIFKKDINFNTNTSDFQKCLSFAILPRLWYYFFGFPFELEQVWGHFLIALEASFPLVPSFLMKGFIFMPKIAIEKEVSVLQWIAYQKQWTSPQYISLTLEKCSLEWETEENVLAKSALNRPYR